MHTAHFKLTLQNAWHARSLLLALLSLTTTACAPISPVSPAVVTPPSIPSPPQVNEPQPSGSYWLKLSDLKMKRCLLGQKVRALLNQTVMPCEPS